MCTGYFYEKTDNQQRWLSTYITVKKQLTPFYRLLTGGKYERFILTTPYFRCHWGQCLHDEYAYYAGIKLYRNPIEIDAKFMPIAPITSADIEKFKEQPANPMPYWANFYAKQLLNSRTSFLSAGHWKIFPLKGHIPYKSDYDYYVRDIYIDLDLIQSFNDSCYYFDWGGFPFDSVFSLKPLPYQDNGRVKWWCKKIIENSCPPLLFWWQEHSQSLLLIDGHARLKAYQQLNKRPQGLVISAYQSGNVDIYSAQRIKERLKVFAGLKHSLESSGGKVNVQSINDIIIRLYDDYHTEYLTTIPKTIAHIDDIFEQDLYEKLSDTTISETEHHFIRSLLMPS